MNLQILTQTAVIYFCSVFSCFSNYLHEVCITVAAPCSFWLLVKSAAQTNFLSLFHQIVSLPHVSISLHSPFNSPAPFAASAHATIPISPYVLNLLVLLINLFSGSMFSDVILILGIVCWAFSRQRQYLTICSSNPLLVCLNWISINQLSDPQSLFEKLHVIL